MMFEAVQELRSSGVCLRSLLLSESEKINHNVIVIPLICFSGGLGAGCSLPEWIPRVSLTALFRVLTSEKEYIFLGKNSLTFVQQP